MLVLRSIAFNVLFYVNTVVLLFAAMPTFFMPYRAVIVVAKFWARLNILLLRVVCGLKYEVRGGPIPKGPVLVAAKHQSTWETFGLLPLFDDPVIILKRELQWIPIFGWYTIKGRMVPVDRRKGAKALTAMIERARIELATGRQLMIFPEGTRRPAGAEPAYKKGVVHLYAAEGVPCVPVALNSGMFWRRRSFLRYPGTIVVEVLPSIPPGLRNEDFAARLQDAIETATARLIAEARAEGAPG